MTVYVIGQMKFKDVSQYRIYEAEFPKVFFQYGGKVLVSDENTKVMKGDWDFDKTVLLEFPSEDEFKAFATSEAYNKIVPHRDAGGDITLTLVKQFPQPK